MIYTPRPYQQDAIDKSVDFLLSPKQENGIVIIPTGGGKSLCIAETVRRLDAPTIVFQPSKELLQQNEEKFVSFGYKPSVYSASVDRREIGEITLATIGSVRKTPDVFRHVKYVLMDECHLCSAKVGMYKDFFAALGNVKICGYTASPFRLATNSFGSELRFLTRTRPRIFSKVIYYINNAELFRDGYLARLEYKEVKCLDKSKLRVNSTGADFTDESVKRQFDEIDFRDKIVRCVDRLWEIGRKNALVFTRFIEEAEYVTSKVDGAAIVTSETPKKERADIVEGFKAGRIRCLVNVSCFIHGFDYPELESVVLAAPTMSLARYYQEVGRIIRPHPSKEYGLVVDMVGLVETFGKVEDLAVDENGGKWCIRSGTRQLTNVYYGDEVVESEQASITGPIGVPPMAWSRNKQKNGRVFYSATPNDGFWAAWNERKEAIKALGVSVKKETAGWMVSWSPW